VLGGLGAFAPLSIDMYLPGLPQMARDLQGSPASGSFTLAAFFAGMCLGQLFYGPLSDRVGRRGPLLAGIALYVVATAGGALSRSMDALIIWRFFQALGGSAGLVISRAMVRDRFSPQETAHVYSMLFLVLALGPVIAPLLGSFILLVASWRVIFWVLTAFGVLVGVAATFGITESRSASAAAHARAESPLGGYLSILRKPQVMAYALAAGFSHVGPLTYVANTPDVIITGFHLSPQAYGWILALNGVGLITANYLNRKLLARLGYDAILRSANLASLTAAAVLLVDGITGFGRVWGVTIPFFLIISALGFTQANAFAGAMAHDPHRSGSISALVGFLQAGLGALGAALAGALHDGTAKPLGAVILAAYILAGLCLRLPSGPLAPSRQA
jgi:MFS transporter, DHA1 family, multidrug resistance protein